MAKREHWKCTTDYAFRNISTGDEEETRIYEDMDSYREGMLKEGVPKKDVDAAMKLISSAAHLSYDKAFKFTPVKGLEERDWKYLGKAAKILEKHISHKALAKKDYGKWEDAFLSRAQCSRS